MTADFSKVLVVGTSQINRVVVSKIVERSGLKPVSEAPETATKALHDTLAATVVLDGGADNRECDAVISSVAGMRRATGKPFPFVILLSNKNGTPVSLDLPSLVDAVVTKPITPERLQPVIDRFAIQRRERF